MTNYRWLVLAPVAAMIVGCASVPTLPPKAGPEEVALYDPNNGTFPDEGYKTIAPVEVELPLGSPIPDLMLELRAEAARLGADGVILRQITRNQTGDLTNLNREQLIIAQGLAIYYPDPATTEQQ